MPTLNESHQINRLMDGINAQLNHFDILALLRLLKHHGYAEQSWWFSSYNNIASQNRLVQSVRLEDQQVFIEVNMGLLSSTGIVPEHIRKFMDNPDVDDQQLQVFLALFDHMLISHYLGQLYPQINVSFFEYYAHTQACYVRLQNLRSEVSLHTLLNTAFPECLIHIARAPDTSFACQCHPTLGKMTLGLHQTSTVKHNPNHISVHLTLRDEWNDFKYSWQQELSKRIKAWLIPWLEDFSISITFYLHRPGSAHTLKLQEQSVLGYEPFYRSSHPGTNEKAVSGYRPMLIHQQVLPHAARQTVEQPGWEEWRRLRI